MGWPSLSATRYHIKDLAVRLADKWKDHPKPAPIFMGFNPIINALLSGDEDIIESVIPVTMRLLEATLEINDDYIQSSPVFSDLVSLACFAHAYGHDQTDTFQRIAKMKGVKDRLYQSLQGIIKEIIEGPSASRKSKYKPGHIDTESVWFKVVAQWPIDHVYTMALCPDHPLWNKTLRHFVIPLALLLTHQQSYLSFRQVLAQGAYFNLHPQVLYERTSVKPDWGTPVQMDNPSTWLGFDAIEIYNNTMLIYHYLGFTWQAPLEFDPMHPLNPFASVEQRDLGWSKVKDTVNPKLWDIIDRNRSELEQVHVIVYDSTAARFIESHLERAARFYNLSLRAIDLVEM